jgi:hypothetical protein
MVRIRIQNFPEAGSVINSSGSSTLETTRMIPNSGDYLHNETLERYALKIVSVFVVELEVVVEDKRRLHVHRHL